MSASQVEKRRSFTKKQNLRRRVYRDMTTFQVFPLQAMAMDDYDQQVKEYFNVDQSDSSDEGDVVSDGSESAPRRQQARDETSSSSECDLLKQFRREFLKEKSIPMTAVEDGASASASSKAEFSGDRQANGSQLDYPTQNENTSSVLTDRRGEADSTEINGGINSSSDDKEHDSRQKALANSMESDNKTQLDHPQEVTQQKQPKAESSSSSSVDEPQHVRGQDKGQFVFISTLWSMEPRIFAMETALKGKRRYISAHLGRFMDHYWRECDVYNRHYYELIKEGTPCRLYFGE